MRPLKRVVLRRPQGIPGPPEPPDLVDPLVVYWTTDHHTYPVSAGGPGEDPDGSRPSVGNRLFWDSPRKLRQFVAAVNAAETCHMVAHTGDMVELGTDWSLFHDAWDDLPVDIPQILTPGNHDFAGSSYSVVRSQIGRAAEPEIAGSALNYAFSIAHSETAYRMIAADTNYLASYEHGAITLQRFHPDGLDWIESELLTCVEDDVIIWTHGSIHEHTGGHFYEPSASAFRSMVEGVLAIRPELQVTCLFGHYHRTSMRHWTSLGPDIPGYSPPAAVDDGTERFCIVRLGPGTVIVEEHGW